MKRRKSKYELDYSAFKSMSEQDLRTYIRGASKVISSRMGKIKKSPYAKYSKSLDRYNTLRSSKGALSKGFKTKGLDYGELRKMANYVNTIISGMETIGGLKSYDEALKSLDNIMRKDKTEGRKLWEKLIDTNFDAIKEYVSKNIDTWISYVGSDGVNDVFNINEYGSEEDKYMDLFNVIREQYIRQDLKVKGKKLQDEQRLRHEKGIRPSPTRSVKYRGKFKK